MVVLLLPLSNATARRGSSDVRDVNPLQLSPKMARFLLQHIKSGLPRQIRLNSLLTAIFSDRGLGIDYGNLRTLTAEETFDARSGNCLSFTFLFVAMARHLGLHASFKEVAEVTSRDLRGELLVANHHMFAEVELDNGVASVDFLPGTDKNYKHIRRIDNQRAFAHYFNNLGAESLADKKNGATRAVELFRRALEYDETFVPAWTNLGVAYRRLKEFDLAEQSYLSALKIERADLTAASNLASLYLATGQTEAAAPLMERVKNHLETNPFHHYRLGLEAQRFGKKEAALKHLREANRRGPGDANILAALGRAYAETGNTKKARELLGRALRRSVDEEQKTDLHKQLEDLNQGS